MSADTLTFPSRDFHEYAKLKVALSLGFAGVGLLLLGLACEDGGQSNAYDLRKDVSGTTNWQEEGFDELSAGFGFACFVELLGAIVAFAVSIYFSSALCGSLNEKKTIRTPLEIEQVYPDYGSSTSKAQLEEESPPIATATATPAPTYKGTV